MSRIEWQDLLRAYVALVGAQITVWTTPIGRLVRAQRPELAFPDDTTAPADGRAGQLALTVRRAASRGLLRPSCLVRALALSRLLEASGLEGGVIRIGVRQSARRVEMHAWVEYGGRPLGEQSEDPAAFDLLTDVTRPSEF
jgi:transglutaminase superfamily protein